MVSQRKRSTPQPDFSAARRAFDRWRKSRSSGERIPEQLWRSAVRLGRKYGINPTAKALGLDYYSLKNRLNGDGAAGNKRRKPIRRAAHRSAFVELPVASDSRHNGHAVVLERRDGTKLRVELGVAPQADDLEAIARALLSAAQ